MRILCVQQRTVREALYILEALFQHRIYSEPRFHLNFLFPRLGFATRNSNHSNAGAQVIAAAGVADENAINFDICARWITINLHVDGGSGLR